MSNKLLSYCIVNANENMARGISGFINAKKGFNCLGIFLSAEETLQHLPRLSPAVALVDITMPGITGIDCIRQLKSQCKDTQFMMYTSCDDETTVLTAFKAGAAAYILSSGSLKDLAGHIRELHNGGSPISSSIARKLIQWLQQPGINNQEKYAITKREKEILLLLDKGGSYNTIADSLFISPKTVRKHIYNIYGKLKVSSKIEAVNRFFGRN
jgi:DNA-binding NarL/FixJ family response regulator